MIKITFEVSEDFIRENGNPAFAADKVVGEKDGNRAIKTMFDAIGFNLIKKQLDAGKTEFVVTPDKLDEQSMNIYNGEIGKICMMAAFSETDKEKD